MTERDNVDPEEIEKFNELAHRWWTPKATSNPSTTSIRAV